MVKDKVIYDIDEIKRISREIDAITGVIDDDKKEELKLKYPGFRSLNMLIKSHNKKFGGNKPSVKNTNKKNHSKANFKSINKKNQSKANAEFKKKLGKINHFIDDDERIKLNPKNYENFNRLINIQNNGFIKKEQSEILKEFNSTLRKSTEIIDEKEIENFKIKYTKDYHDFFTSLNMEKSINKFNRDLKKKQKAEIVSILRNKYSSLNEPISKQAVSDLISKYPDGECGILIKKYNKQYFNNKYRYRT